MGERKQIKHRSRCFDDFAVLAESGSRVASEAVQAFVWRRISSQGSLMQRVLMGVGKPESPSNKPGQLVSVEAKESR